MISIRQAGRADAGFLITCNLSLALESEGKALSPEVLSQGVLNLLERPQLGFYLIAEYSDRPAGCLMVTTEWSDWRNGLFWWIQSVYVTPEFRRRGMYRRLYGEVQALARSAKDVIGFRLYVEKDNRAAQETYRAQGMAETHYRLFEAPLGPEVSEA